jgi:hypothetical protein
MFANLFVDQLDRIDTWLSLVIGAVPLSRGAGFRREGFPHAKAHCLSPLPPPVSPDGGRPPAGPLPAL